MAQRPLAPTLIALVVLLGITVGVAVAVIVLSIIRRRVSESQRLFLETEVERWKILAREKLRKARAASITSERLRTSMRSLSRGRATVSSQDVRADAQVGDGKSLSKEISRSESVERRNSQDEAQRSVSRGRTGKRSVGHEAKESLRVVEAEDDMGEEMWESAKRVGEELWELDGQQVSISKGPSSSAAHCSLITAREAAEALQTLTKTCKGKREMMVLDSHTWIKPAILPLRDVCKNKPLPLTPVHSLVSPKIISPDWGDSQTLATSPQQNKPLKLLPQSPSQQPNVPLSALTSLHRSLPSLSNGSQALKNSSMHFTTSLTGPMTAMQQLEGFDSPPADITVMDHYVAWAEMRQTSRSRAARTEKEALIMDHHAALREINDNSRMGTPHSGIGGRGLPIDRIEAESSTENFGSCSSRIRQLENSSSIGRGKRDDMSLHTSASNESASSGSSCLVIMRHGNGLLGSSQSDENFKHNHALAEDAVSLTSSQRKMRKVLCIRKVGNWASESAVAVVEPSGEVTPGDELQGFKGENLGTGERANDRSADSTGHFTVKRLSIRQAREAFGQWVVSRREGARSISRGRTHARGRV